MTKAERIRQLDDHGFFSLSEIAGIVSREIGPCCPEYVSAVLQRSKAGGIRAYDAAFVERFKRRHGVAPYGHKYRTDPEFAERARARRRAYYWRRKLTDAAHV